MNMRKRTDLEVKFDTFMGNHWMHMVKDVANAFVVGVWAVDMLR